jgi:hypothetical protein
MTVAACSTAEERVPAACTEGPQSVRAALVAAPGEVRLHGVPLADCLTKDSDADDVQRVGATWVEVATGLSREARAHANSAEALRLGYLVGAARRGGAHTQGIHAELLRRLEQETATVDTRSRAFRRGERAGRGR